MTFFIFSLLMAILNIISFFINESILGGYINLIIGCGCFFCSGMTLQRIADENNMKNDDWTYILGDFYENRQYKSNDDYSNSIRSAR